MGHGRRKLLPRLGSLVSVGAATAKVEARFVRPSTPSKDLLVIPPAQRGSIGDELLVAGLLGNYEGTVETINWSSADGWGVPSNAALTTWLIARGGITKRQSPPLERLGSGSACFIGADVLDGAYGISKPGVSLRLLSEMSQRGWSCAVVNFSFRSTADARLCSLIKQSDSRIRFVSRGSTSADHFTERTGRSCETVPDLSWSYWAAQERTEIGGLSGRVGINVSAHGLSANGLTKEYIARQVRLLAASGFEPLAIPHDRRALEDDVSLLREIFAMAGLPHRDIELSPLGVSRTLGTVDAVLSGRMHLTIAALAHGVPVLALPYNEKFDDLSDIGLPARALTFVGGSTRAGVSSELTELALSDNGHRSAIRNRATEIARNVGDHYRTLLRHTSS